jgi:uncharacterized protein (DUF1697 family)
VVYLEYVAFLRGINNIGGNTIKMGTLKEEFESFGFKNVKTVLASGNVIFGAEKKNELKLSQEISLKLEKSLGRKTTVIIRSMDSLRALYDKNPFGKIKTRSNTKNCITFVPDPNKRLSRPNTEHFTILSTSNGAICATFLWSEENGTREFMQLMEKEYGKDVTTRFWNTIIRIIKASG